MSDERKIKLLISAYADGETSAEETREVEALIKNDPQYNRYYHELKKISSSLLRWEDEDLSFDFKNIESPKIKTQKQSFKAAAWGSGALVTTLVIMVVVGQMSIKRGVQGRLKSAPSDISYDYKVTKDEIAYENLSSFKAKLSGSADQPALFKEKSDMPNRAITDASQNEPYYLAGIKKEEGSFRTESEQQLASYDALAVPGSSLPSKRVVGGRQGRSYDSDNYAYNDLLIPALNKSLSVSDTEEYARQDENPFLEVTENPLSTFSIDVDTASYSNIRRFLNNGQMPPVDSVRIEEMLNYFTYNYPESKGRDPVSITLWGGVCPWNENHRLVQIGLKGKTPDASQVTESNLVFLIDVSGSMNQPDKLPLLKTAFSYLAQQLTRKEHVAIVVYAGAAGLVLDSTNGNQKNIILNAIQNLQAGGSTAGGAGIQLAYKIAEENLIEGGNNRVILATDGDFNVGVSSTGELTRLIEEKREKGIFLTVLGFGTGNYKDSRLEGIADKGNGNYYYIDNEREAKKVFVEELGSTLFTIAKDVKLQIEFNPSEVKAYRLIGYENRILAKEDFNNDRKDAGEMGAGHTVTALYEIVPADLDEKASSVDQLKYQINNMINSDEMMTFKLRYKDPQSFNSQLIVKSIKPSDIKASFNSDFAFASAVAEFGLILKQSQYRGTASLNSVLQRLNRHGNDDPYGHKREFRELVQKAQFLEPQESIIYSEEEINFKGQQ